MSAAFEDGALVSSELTFRTMVSDDLKQVMEIEVQAYSHPWTLGIFKDCVRGYRCWVAMQEEGIVGYAVLMMAPGEAHVLNLCVKPDQQRKGIGRALLRLLEKSSAQGGVDMLLLEVRRSNQSAIDLYEDEGFHELGVRKAYYPADDGREDAIIFAKYLSLSSE